MGLVLANDFLKSDVLEQLKSKRTCFKIKAFSSAKVVKDFVIEYFSGVS